MKEEIKNTLNIGDKTADAVMLCYNEAKKLDENIEMFFTEDRVGVGKKGEPYRFCFLQNEGETYIRFLNSSRKIKLMSCSFEELLSKIGEINDIFVRGEFKISKRTKKSFRVEISKSDFINILSRGVDPLSGKQLFTPSSDIKIALKNIALFVLRYDKIDSKMFRVITSPEEIKAQEEKIIKQKRARQVVDENNGRLWTEKEDELLVKEYKDGVDIEKMMELHGRTRSAIERRILKLIPISELTK